MENNKLVENFLFAVVGTGINVDDGQDDEGKIFGPGTYELLAALALQNYDKGQEVMENSSYADGFFRIKGKLAKRANSDSFAFELPKEVKEDLYAHPYAYDKENAEVIYAVLCPKCKEIYFIRD